MKWFWEGDRCVVRFGCDELRFRFWHCCFCRHCSRQRLHIARPGNTDESKSLARASMTKRLNGFNRESIGHFNWAYRGQPLATTVMILQDKPHHGCTTDRTRAICGAQKQEKLLDSLRFMNKACWEQRSVRRNTNRCYRSTCTTKDDFAPDKDVRWGKELRWRSRRIALSSLLKSLSWLSPLVTITAWIDIQVVYVI